MIYCLEPLCYYYDMKPYEFWNATYTSISQFLKAHIIKRQDDLRRDIDLLETLSNKMIQADSFSKHPKVVPIRDSYKELYEKQKEETMTPEEIKKRMKAIMKYQ